MWVPSSEHFAGPKESIMSDQRREFLAAAGIASLAAPGAAQPGRRWRSSFMNNVPDPTLAGKDLPTFKFALEKSDGKVVGNSYGNEATVMQLPICKGIAGVSMRLEPGAMRTLHWHPNADEWQYVVEGEVSVTLLGSLGRYRIERLQKGDVGYIQQGYGHSIENVGSGNALMPASTRPSTCRNDCGKSKGRARHKFWPADGSVRKIRGSRGVHRRARIGPDRGALKARAGGTCGAILSVKPGVGLAQSIGIKCVGQEYADADEDEECRHDFSHSLPPCVAMPERARLINPR